jgi:hypothetical protein
MKNIIRGFVLIIMLAGLLLVSTTSQGHAQGVASTPTATAIFTSPDSITFDALGQSDIVMRGPYAFSTIRYAPPSSWALQDGAMLTLVIDASSASQDTAITQSSGAGLQVTLNGNLITTVLINWTGVQTINILIPAVALPSIRLDGRHDLNLFLDAAADCNFPQKTTVVIRSSSFISLPHTVVPLVTNLSLLPSPIYQRYAFQIDPAVLVVPANPTVDELKAAMSIQAGFGRLTSGVLVLPLVPLNLLTDLQKQSSHLIFVGKASSLQTLNAVRFPVEVLPQGLLSPGAQVDDGYVQMAISPWNQSRVILYAGGNTDVGVVKSAQAISTGAIQPSAKTNLAIISSVNASVQIPPVAEDRTLANLGYTSQEVAGYGESTLEYHFYIPPGQIPGAGPYLNLVYTHSSLMDFNNSGLVVILNDQRIGSTSFSQITAAQTNTIKFNLPADMLRTGDNKLLLLADLQPLNFCSPFLDNRLWFTVNTTSLLHLPLIPALAGIPSALLSLNQYPIPFLNSPSLDSVGFVLDKDDFTSWNVAASLAAYLGRRSAGQVLAPEVVFADSVTDDFLKSHDLIVIGRPSRLPLLANMATAMPAPFEPGKDQAVERNLSITYRLPTDASIGYIELFASPYADRYVVMTLLGSTDEALTWVDSALTISSLRSKLTGNYAVINHEQILATDTRLGLAQNLSATAVPGASSILPSLPITPAAQTSIGLRWILPGIVVISLLIVALLVFIVISSRRGDSPLKK